MGPRHVSRVERSSRMLGVALGDAVAIAFFVVLGELRHGGSLVAGIETFGQFGVAWVLVAVAAGAYGSGALDRPGTAVLWGIGTWAVAALLAQLIRALMVPGDIQPVFVVVSIAFGGLFIGTWRYVAARRVRDRLA